MCTNLRVTAVDGSVVVARSMEFGIDPGWRVMVAPAGNAFTGTAPNGAGHAWTAQHGCVGVAALGRPHLTDGMNDAGLFAGLLYLPGLARYADPEGVASDTCISIDEVATLVLTQAASVDEAIAVAQSVTVWNRVEELLGDILPLHLVVHDRTGACAVIEWIDGVCRVHHSPVGVCTNNPSYDWHLTNLRNYVNLRALNAGPLDINGETFAGLGQGTGLLGLPGDWTPPSRFVRATALSATVRPPTDAPAAVLTALHMINTFDIPLGLVRSEDADEYTAWVSIADLARGVYVIRTFEDPTPRQLVLADLGLDAGPVATYPLPANPEPLAFLR